MKKLLLLTIFLFVIYALPEQAQAAISFVGSAENGAANNADPTADLTTISGLAENDLVIAACGLGDADAVNGDVTMNTAGYTGLSDLFQDDTHETNLEVFYKFMGSTPDTSAVCEGSTLGNDTGTAIVVMVFRGVDTTTPFDVASTSATAIDDPDADPPSIDWSTTGTWVVIAAASAHALGNTCTSDAYLFPTGYTTDQIECAGDDTTDISVGMGYNSAPADPENPGIVDHNGTDSTSNTWAAVTMALRPSTVFAPAVTTGFTGNVNSTYATLFGNITSDGGASITQHGFATSTSPTLSSNVSTTTLGSGSQGEFNNLVLLPETDTTYYYRAYVTNSVGTGYGVIRSFATGNSTATRTFRLFRGHTIRLYKGIVRIHRSANPPLPSVSFIGCTESATSATTYTYSSHNVGTEDATRKTIIGAIGHDAASVFGVSSITVGGASATEIVDENGTFNIDTALYIVGNPSGTAEDIVVTWSEAITHASIVCVWAAYNLNSSTAIAFTSDSYAAGAGPLDLSLNTNKGGIAVGVCAPWDSLGTATWTGLTERFDGGTNKSSAADLQGTLLSTPLSVSCDWTTGADASGVTASFR